jgi:hypothetical protein
MLGITSPCAYLVSTPQPQFPCAVTYDVVSLQDNQTNILVINMGKWDCGPYVASYLSTSERQNMYSEAANDTFLKR